MLKPPVPENEAERLATLRALDVLDTAADERFDRITRLARQIFDVPIALVSLIDAERQWFKSRAGLDVQQTPREISFCGHAITQEDCMVVSDARDDVRFADNPLVIGDPRIRFYAAYPVCAPNGCALGRLCLIDTAPRQFSAEDEQLLRDLGGTVEQLFSATALATFDELTGLLNRRLRPRRPAGAGCQPSPPPGGGAAGVRSGLLQGNQRRARAYSR